MLSKSYHASFHPAYFHSFNSIHVKGDYFIRQNLQSICITKNLHKLKEELAKTIIFKIHFMFISMFFFVCFGLFTVANSLIHCNYKKDSTGIHSKILSLMIGWTE